MNPIEAAVAPLKNDAVEKSAHYAQRTIDYVLSDLALNTMDAQIVAPYPDSKMMRPVYMAAKSKYSLYRMLTEKDESDIRMQGLNRHRFGAPDVRKKSIENEAHFIKNARENAAAQYDAFVAKLVKKIGPVESATLEGSHVWGYSFLHVVKADGSRETWKTQQIVNISKLGKVFNQWPSRKVKA